MKKKLLENITPEHRLTIQLFWGIVLFIFGVTLLFMGMLMPPMGVIDSSVLTAFGEIGTFASALCGMDYSYKSKKVNLEREYEEKIRKIEQTE